MTKDELLERGDETVTIRQIVERFESVEEEYSGMPWTLKQIYTQIDMLVSEKPCEDCISRQDLREPRFIIAENDYQKGWNDALESVYENAPSIQPKQKMGRWIEHFDESGKWYECDQCHTDWGGTVNYCPNCGAKM